MYVCIYRERYFFWMRPGKVHPKTEILTFDITSLCTSTSHEYGLKTLRYFP